MESEISKLSKSKQTAAKTVYETFLILKEAGGQLQGREVINRIRERIKFSDWENENYEKSGYVRWESILHFLTVDCQKAGFLRKAKGVWYLTDEGEKAIEMGPVKLLETVSRLYREWAVVNRPVKSNNEAENTEPDDLEEIKEGDTQLQKANLDQLEEQALEGLKDFIIKKNPYEFQDLVAALLRAMKYHTPFISPKGRDGGLDIVAYRDPLGASEPRIKVQVKHKPNTAVPVDDIRSLIGLLNKTGDIGLFVTSGYFSSDAERTARDSHIHVRLIDIDYFIQLWQEFYSSMTDDEKNMLPLHRIYFLGSNE